jgi:outer membrane protein OmpA-like peptidoglycan-associated protein
MVNTEHEEIMPLISANGKSLYFVRSLSPRNNGGKDGGQDVWVSERVDDTTFTRAVSLGLPINNTGNNAICGISFDGNTIYLTNVYRGKKMDPGVSVSTKTETGWSLPVSLKIQELNIQRGYLGAHMSKSENTLVLSMKSDKSFGREDLYVTFKDPGTGEWSKPKNLGNTINTVGFETSPFLADGDSILYFSSNGHEGLGDADIYFSKRLDDTWTKWSKPQNLGDFFNGDGFDAYLSIGSDSTVFFAKENSEKNFCDIYYTHQRNLKRVVEEALRKKLPKVDSSLLANKLSKELEDQKKAEEELNKRERVIVSDFDNILFDFAKHDLKPEGRNRLDKLYAYMQKNPSVGVELIGHADSIDTELVNLILSVKRSEEAKNYLIRKGISKRRILTHGFGKQVPVAPNRTAEGRRLNRRVEINILVDDKVKTKLDKMPAIKQ